MKACLRINWSILLFMFILVILAENSFASSRVLLTAFDPFEGRVKNASQYVAVNVMQELGREGIDTELCLLPVVFNKAAQSAIACYEADQEKPDLIVSLGEAGCQIRLETRAKNYDSEWQPQRGHQIISGAPDYLAFSAPISSMVCALPKSQRKEISISKSAGDFVCNNTAYHLAHYLRGTKTKFSFIHVPKFPCGEKSDPEKNAKIVTTMIRAALRSSEKQNGSSSRLACEPSK